MTGNGCFDSKVGGMATGGWVMDVDSYCYSRLVGWSSSWYGNGGHRRLMAPCTVVQLGLSCGGGDTELTQLHLMQSTYPEDITANKIRALKTMAKFALTADKSSWPGEKDCGHFSR